MIFLDVTNVGGIINYWFEWPQQKGKFVESSEAMENWPRLVFNFLESKLVWSDECQYQRNVDEIEKLKRTKKLNDVFIGHKMGK